MPKKPAHPWPEVRALADPQAAWVEPDAPPDAPLAFHLIPLATPEGGPVRYFPPSFTVHYGGEASLPDATLRVRIVRRKVLEVTEITFKASDEDEPIPRSLLSALNLGEMVTEALELVAFEGPAWNDAPQPHLARRRRRPVIDQLDEVAAAYRSGGIAEVRERCYVGERHAYGLVKQARDKGLLPPKQTKKESN